LFNKESLKDEDGNVEIDKLMAFNEETLSTKSEGQFFLGSLRFMQKRIKPQPCLAERASSIPRYEKY
jgi:hypothetical protein